MLTKRTNILFDDALWAKLVEVAKKQKTSVGSLVRETLSDKYMQEESFEKRKKAIEEIERIRPHFKGKLDYKALINYGRRI